jgi:glyoxylase-like metal-dependent hydrolase (beta-lactamase superfamily II)
MLTCWPQYGGTDKEPKMAITIKTFPGGPIETNAYLVIDTDSHEALVIDAPEGVTDEIIESAKQDSASITQIVITHTHWDHIGDAAEMKEKTGAPLLAHELAVPGLAKPGSVVFELPKPIPPVTADRLVKDGDTVTLGNHAFAVLHLPGHDIAHIALYSEPDRIFLGGDVLFPGGHGRTDVPGTDQATMERSLARLVDFPPDVVVYPGHGKTTTIGDERWLQQYRGLAS